MAIYTYRIECLHLNVHICAYLCQLELLVDSCVHGQCINNEQSIVVLMAPDQLFRGALTPTAKTTLC